MVTLMKCGRRAVLHGAKFAETAKVETISKRNVKRFMLSVIRNHMNSLAIHPIVNSMTIGYMRTYQEQNYRISPYAST